MNATLRRSIDYAALIVILCALVGLFSALSDNFFTARNFGNIANRIPTLAILATGMTLVLIIGGIDLSVGSVLAFAGAGVGMLIVEHQISLWLALPIAIAIGAFAGIINGSISVKFKVPAFIVTLGMLEMARGAAYLLTESKTQYLNGALDPIIKPISNSQISIAFIMAMSVVTLGHLLLTRSVFGRKMIAVGTNETATRLAGIDPRPIKIWVFTIAGACAGLAAICNLARLGASDPNGGIGMELSAIAAAVIGGTSLSGGRGSVLCSFLGVLIIATLEAGLAQVGVNEPMKRLITGSVIILAVIADSIRKRA